MLLSLLLLITKWLKLKPSTRINVPVWLCELINNWNIFYQKSLKYIFGEYLLMIKRNQKKDISIDKSKLKTHFLWILDSGNICLHEAIKSLYSESRTISNYVQINSCTKIAGNITLEATYLMVINNKLWTNH